MNQEITIWTSKEAAAFLKISEYSLREMCRKHLIPHSRVGNKHYRFTKETLTNWILEQEVKNLIR